MRKCLLFVLFVFSTESVWGQDKPEVTFSQESDTLVRQRFMDRYENVFMTMVPTRHMLRLGLSQYYQREHYPISKDNVFNNTSLMLGYEFKFLPAFSIALSGHMPFHWEKSYQAQTYFNNIILDGQLRWFINMRRRIKAGKSANNFSGNYIAAFYSVPGNDRQNAGIGLKFGFQRRFLNYGFLDFAFALRQEQPFFYYGLLDNWSFSSQASFGFALGDWKRSVNPPLCDILFCDEMVRQQWKIRLPETTIGYYNNKIRLGAAYERRFATSPFSMNFQLDAAMNNGFNNYKLEMNQPGYPTYSNDIAYSREKNVSFSIQPRYYFLQKRRQLKGRASGGLSGLYTGIHTEYNYYKGKHSRYPVDLIIENHIVRAGVLAGFQLRLFRRGYFDYNTSYNVQDYLGSTRTTFGFNTNISVGLAF